MSRTITGFDHDRILMKMKYKRFWREKDGLADGGRIPIIRKVVETALSEN
jgi:hypothetical protein